MYSIHERLEFHAIRTQWSRRIGIHVIARSSHPDSKSGDWKRLAHDESDRSGLSFQFIPLQPDFVDPPPTFDITMESAQQLMDQLWQCGLRPTEGSGSAGAMAAVQEHLKDMRKLVFERESDVRP